MEAGEEVKGSAAPALEERSVDVNSFLWENCHYSNHTSSYRHVWNPSRTHPLTQTSRRFIFLKSPAVRKRRSELEVRCKPTS